MKNTIKMFGIIAMVAVIGFPMMACDTESTGNSTSGNVGTIVSGATVTVSDGVTIPESGLNFIYFQVGLLSEYIDSPSVTVSGGKVTIKLGAIKSEYLRIPAALIESGCTVKPSDMKCASPISPFITEDRSYCLYCKKDANNNAYLFYVDRDTTITGTNSSDGYTYQYNMNLKAGWNYYIVSESGTTITFTASQSLPSGYNWVVDNHYDD